MKNALRFALPYAISALPVLALAQNYNDLNSSFESIIDLINTIVIPLIIGVAGLYFMVGVIKYVTAGEKAESREGARNMMIWGIIALFVMISVWGLVNILVETFDLQTNLDSSDIPSIPSSGY